MGRCTSRRARAAGSARSDCNSGVLTDLAERLPEEPMVVQPYDAIGKYGGRARWISIGPESGNSEFLSARHVNLVRFLDDGRTIVPNVAKSFEANDDFTEITFELRKGHKWSDGHPFTVDDILFIFRRHLERKPLACPAAIKAKNQSRTLARAAMDPAVDA